MAMSPEERLGLLELAAPRIVEPYVPHVPHAPQSLFLMDQGKEAFYGGAAGGGKSDALLMAALQYVDVPGYSALVIRRSYSDLTLPGAIMDRANQWLQDTPAKPYQGKGWVFPSGARLTFGYIMWPRDVGQFKSAEFQFIAFDELTQFHEGTYQFMFSRLRKPAVVCENCNVMVEKLGYGEVSAYMDLVGTEVADESGWVHAVAQSNYAGRCSRPEPSRRALAEYPPSEMDGTTLFDVPLRMRAASNPGDLGHAWVRDRFVDPERRVPTASFYPALLRDNPSLDQASYADSLSHLGQVERERLLAGNWDVNEEGALFKRSWFQVVEKDRVPDRGMVKMRYWDLAATKASTRSSAPGDPDWTAGALVGLHDGQWYILDLRRVRETPAGVERLIAQTASEDGRRVPVRMEQEGGASGVNTIDHYRRRVLVGYDFDGCSPRSGKEDMARPWSIAAENGNVFLVEGAWNRDFLDEVEAFPFGAHDDQIDAVSGAVSLLAKGPTSRLIA